MKVIIILFVVTLAGCKAGESNPDPESQMLLDYSCSVEQLNRVDKEYEICAKSGFFNSYCYATAKKTQCTKIEQEHSVKEGE